MYAKQLNYAEAVMESCLANQVRVDALLDRPMGPGPEFKPKDRMDFGSPDSIGLHLQHCGFNLGDSLDDGTGSPFRIYCGYRSGYYTVVLKDIFWNLIGVLRYESLAKLKQDWELD